MRDTMMADEPNSLPQILEEEFARLHGDEQFPKDYPGRHVALNTGSMTESVSRLKAFYSLVHSLPSKRSALCLSGGGIRSATFSLGIVQTLARLQLLGRFDYLSTVSGGGYIGSWLTAWIHRHPRGVDGVADELRSGPDTTPGEEPDAVRWLRTYSNYLSPRLGLLSADSWTLIGTYLRNLLLNWVVLLPLLCLALLLPRFLVTLAQFQPSHDAWTKTLLVAGLGLGVMALMYLHLFRPSLRSFREQTMWTRLEGQTWFLVGCLLPLLFSALCLTTTWAWFRNSGGTLEQFTLAHSVVGVAILHLGSWLFGTVVLGRLKAFTPWLLVEMLVILATGALGGFFLWSVLAETPKDMAVSTFAEWYACFGVPGFLTMFLLTATVFIGIASRYTDDHDREWWGRAGSWILIAIAVWSMIGSLVMFGPGLVAYTPTLVASLGGLSGLIALVFGFGSKTTAKEQENPSVAQQAIAWAVKAAAPIFMLFILVLLALGTSWLLDGLAHLYGFHLSNLDHRTYATGKLMPHDPWGHNQVLHNTPSNLLVQMALILATLSFGMAWLININKFSLHAMYRNRLIRAYLGASRPQAERARSFNEFTGFDTKDNIQMSDLAFKGTAIQKPFHVINMALNLVKGDNLAWQQRKAQSFTVSALHSGSWNLGYRASKNYGMNRWVDRSISLGTAMAISGAAASPNMGYHSSAAVTFLLTLFNVRLGWWLGNPGPAGKDTYTRSYPSFSLRPLLSEAFGLTEADSPYVYLSDGGHFENLGLYEMVLRRCHYIVVVDAGCDPDFTFQDLGNALRKIRVDLGIDIEFDLDMLRRQVGSRHSRWHHAIGTIRYDKVDHNGPVGTLLYLKPSLTGDEPTDVQEYAAQHSLFPHEPTADQFFDESQFESYRRLGEHVAWEVLRFGLPRAAEGIGGVSAAVRSHWVTVPPSIQESFLRQSEELVRVEKLLRDDPDLIRYDLQLYPELQSVFGLDPTTAPLLDARSALHVCNLQLQLMENVCLAVELAQYHAHPLCRGWMNLFRRWTSAPTFQDFWPVLRGSYSRPFVQFAEQHLNLGATTHDAIACHELPADVVAQLMMDIEREWPDMPAFTAPFRAALTNPLILKLEGDRPIETGLWVLSFPPSPTSPAPSGQGEILAVAAICRLSVDQHELGFFGWVRPAYRGLGVGSRLFKKALAQLPDLYWGHTLVADLGPDDPTVMGYHYQKSGWLQFYERLGFTRDHAVPDRLRMVRVLKH